MKILRAGTRESLLAVEQTKLLTDEIEKNGQPVELVTMKTTGDRILDRTLDKIGGKGLFVKELDKALIEGRTDISVHSLKDMPMEVPEKLPLAGFSKREDPRDVLVLPEGKTEPDLSKPIGCSSRRRIIQLQKLHPEWTFKSVRGNVITRLKKLDSGEYGAIILAAAGLKRLGLEGRISKYYDPSEVIPSAGQGILVIQGKKGLDYSCLDCVKDEESRIAGTCERAFVRELDGGCSSPIAAFAQINGDEISLSGLYYNEDKKEAFIGKANGETCNAEEIGIKLARKLKKEGDR